MTINQIAEFTNTMAKEVTGEETLVNEDLTNIVDVGNRLFNAAKFDQISRAFADTIGKTIFVIRPYESKELDLYRTTWEYGGALRKARERMPEAVEDDAWALQDGVSYADHVYHAPQISAKYFQDRDVYAFHRSVASTGLKDALKGPDEWAAFVSMHTTATSNALAMRREALQQRAVNNAVAAAYNGTGGTKVNLLALYNAQAGASLTVANCWTDPAFLRFSVMTISDYSDRMTRMSNQYNIGGVVNHTPKDRQRLRMISKLSNSIGFNLHADTRHNEFVQLPAKVHTVPFWQAQRPNTFSGDTSLNVTIKTDDQDGAAVATVNASGIVAVLHDVDAIMLCQEREWITSQYTGVADFTDYYTHAETRLLNDYNENVVVFYVA